MYNNLNEIINVRIFYLFLQQRSDVTEEEGAGIRQVGQDVDGLAIRQARGGHHHLQRGPDSLPRQTLSGTRLLLWRLLIALGQLFFMLNITQYLVRLKMLIMPPKGKYVQRRDA